MDHDDVAFSPIPAGWLDAVAVSDLQLAAGQTVPLEPLLLNLHRTADQLEAVLTAQQKQVISSHKH